ncbi:MAG: NAD-dependent epimerase/dehydratase family protein [Verrucomicrobiota bacterium]|nr:NAD-dependent epimerase/dehydratase family protein [Verrucomicrobiota bacterium]
MGSEPLDILVTGASGALGKPVIARLANSPRKLRFATAGRSIASPHHVDVDLVEPIRSNLRPQTIIHLAGEKRDLSKMWEVNLGGTENLLNWGLAAGTQHFVYVSSVGVYGSDKEQEQVVTPSTPHNPKNEYEKSKSAAEKLVLQFCAKNQIGCTILQPSTVIALSDDRQRPLLSLIRSIQRGHFFFLGKGDGWFNYIGAGDVAAAICAAADFPSANKTYILNTSIRLSEAVGTIAQFLGVPIPKKRLPHLFTSLLAQVAAGIEMVAGRRMPFDRRRLAELNNQVVYDGQFIEQDTGFNYPEGIRKTLQNLIATYRGEGLV